MEGRNTGEERILDGYRRLFRFNYNKKPASSLMGLKQ